MENQYKCVTSLKLPFYDEEERVTEKYGTVEKGSVWVLAAHRGDQPIRLLLRNGSSDFCYIDISVEIFKGCFEEVAAEQEERNESNNRRQCFQAADRKC